jgi:NAD(P)H-dependent FMN reductase
MTMPIKVLGLPGSLRRDSYTRMAVNIALQGAQEMGAQTSLLDLRDYRISLLDLYTEPSADILQLRQQVRSAQGIILGTPEYHGSFSGVLKHVLDLMGFDEFEGKMLGLVGVAGGNAGAINAINGLRTVGRSLHAWVLPDQVSITEVSKAFDANGNPIDPRQHENLKEIGRQVARFAFLHSSEQARDFMRLWETAPANPGGRLA